MKKLLCLIAVFAWTAPLYAGNIAITGADINNGQLQISYNVTSGTDRPVGISMVVSLSDSATVDSTADVLSSSGWFNTHIDYANANPGAQAGHPLANPDANGVPALPASTFALCMGGLWPDPCQAPASETNLVTLQLHDGGAGYTDVTITEDQKRAGIIGESDFNVTYPAAPIRVTFCQGCFPCDASYATQRAQWELVGSPTCWCAPPNGSGYQCDGDVDGINSGPFFYYRVFTADLSQLLAAWSSKLTSTNFDVCADIDHQDSGPFFYYRVFTNDLGRLLAKWTWKDSTAAGTTSLPGNCPRPDPGT